MKTNIEKFKEFIEDSDCSIKLDLLNWKLRFNISTDKNNDCTQIWWCFISFGPLHIKLAQSHWDQW